MIVFWILGGIFIIVGFIMGVRKFIKTYQYRGKAEGVILDYESSTGTGKQSIRVRYQYVISGVKYVAKSEWLNNGSFYPGKKCEVRYNTGNLKNHIWKRLIGCFKVLSQQYSFYSGE